MQIEQTETETPASSVRGKIVVIVMLGGAALLLFYSLWYVNHQTTVDERFNMRRQALPDNISGPLMLPDSLGEFQRVALDVDTLDTPGAQRHGVATYKDVDGKVLRLDVQQTTEPRPTLEALFSDFATRAGGDLANSTIRLHADGPTRYGYGAYSGPTYTYYELTWINANWIIRVSTQEAGSESLLRFVNGIPY